MNPMSRVKRAILAAPMGHVTRGPGEAMSLLFVSVAAVFGVAAFILFDSSRERPRHRILAKRAAMLAVASVVSRVSPR
jgi:hypothetical protein